MWQHNIGCTSAAYIHLVCMWQWNAECN